MLATRATTQDDSRILLSCYVVQNEAGRLSIANVSSGRLSSYILSSLGPPRPGTHRLEGQVAVIRGFSKPAPARYNVAKRYVRNGSKRGYHKRQNSYESTIMKRSICEAIQQAGKAGSFLSCAKGNLQEDPILVSHRLLQKEQLSLTNPCPKDGSFSIGPCTTKLGLCGEHVPWSSSLLAI